MQVRGVFRIVLLAALLFSIAGAGYAEKPPPPTNLVPTACTDDPFEDNDTYLTAPVVQNTSATGVYYNDLIACPGDDDFFAIDSWFGQTVDIRIDFSGATADLDLYFYDVDGLTYLTGSGGVGDSEEVTYQVPANTGTYFVRVISFGSTANAYSMSVAGACDHCRFSYQGQLRNSGAPANGDYQFQFELFDRPTGGYSQAGPIERQVAVTDGLFTSNLYLGSAPLKDSYLEVRVRPASGGTYTPLLPRQLFGAAPYASMLSPTVYLLNTRAVEVYGSGGHNAAVMSYGKGSEEGYYGSSVNYNGAWLVSQNKNGVRAETLRSDNEWGVYTPNKISAANVTAASVTLLARVADGATLAPGDVVAPVGLADPLPGAGESIPLVRLAGAPDSTGAIGVVEARMILVPDDRPSTPDTSRPPTLHSTEGPALPGDYVALTVLGVAQVKIDPGATIQAGERLTVASLAGTARPLRSALIDGMTVAEGAPVLGIALAAAQAGSCAGDACAMLPVFVSLR